MKNGKASIIVGHGLCVRCVTVALKMGEKVSLLTLDVTLYLYGSVLQEKYIRQRVMPET